MCVLSNHKVTGYNPHDRTMHVTKYQVPTLKHYNASYKRGLYIQEEIHPSFQCGTLVPKNFWILQYIFISFIVPHMPKPFNGSNVRIIGNPNGKISSSKKLKDS